MQGKKSFACLVLVATVLALSAGVSVRAWGAGTEAAPPPTATGTTPGEGTGLLTGGTTPEDYVIQVDDMLTLDDGRVRSELSGIRTYRVARDGTIKLIYLGRVEAVGLTKRQLEDKLEKLYDPKFFKNLTLNLEVASKTYSIVGEVRNPGIKNILMKTTIITAIASAGGFTDYAKQSKVIVLRVVGGEQARREIDCEEILKGKAKAEFLIEPNDVIWVPPKGLF